MAHHNVRVENFAEPRLGWRGLLIHDWHYLLMLALALIGVAYTNFARAAMANYWLLLTPIFCAICISVRWRYCENSLAVALLIVTQLFHWVAVVLRCISCLLETSVK